MGLSWKAVRKEKIYCAPACGFECTHKAYLKARAKARAALKLLKNKTGWKVAVWENCGWHTSIQKGGMKIYIHEYTIGKLEYSVLFSADDGIGGESFWSENFHSEDPNEVIERQLKLANDFVKRCQDAIFEASA